MSQAAAAAIPDLAVPGTLLRPLGWQEQAFSSAGPTVLTATEIAAPFAVLSEEKLRAAALHVASMHPLLRANVYNDGETAVFRTADVQLVPATVLRVSAEDAADHERRGEPWWQKVVEDEMNVPFQLGCPTPLFRLAWVSRDQPQAGPPFEHLLAVQFHHCAGDGTSGNILTHEVLSHLAAAEPPAPILLPLLPDPERLQFPELEASLTPAQQTALAALEEEVLTARRQHTLVLPYDTEFA
eukprot:EG_transcript_26717